MTESFIWSSKFLTHIDTVDKQHHKLVDIINDLGAYLHNDKINRENIESIIKELFDYSVYHFSDEEHVMSQAKIDSRHLKKHVKIHKKFIKDIEFIYSSLDTSNKKQIRILLEYLIPWLGRHILGIDQDMAHQIQKIEEGMSPKDAYDLIGEESLNVSEPLVDVLYDLFIHVATQNKKLQELNESLEEKVATRTKELSEANAHLEKLAITDALTGLPNRRYAMHSFDVLWNEATTKSKPLSCFMIDVDHFKDINDGYGHDVGDFVLVELTKAITESLRNDDIFCRLGGDEFILICPNTDKAGAQHVAEIIQSKVAQMDLTAQIKSWKCGMSIGGALRTANMKDYNELIKVADETLYAAKEAGRGCMRFNG